MMIDEDLPRFPFYRRWGDSRPLHGSWQDVAGGDVESHSVNSRGIGLHERTHPLSSQRLSQLGRRIYQVDARRFRRRLRNESDQGMFLTEVPDLVSVEAMLRGR